MHAANSLFQPFYLQCWHFLLLSPSPTGFRSQVVQLFFVNGIVLLSSLVFLRKAVTCACSLAFFAAALAIDWDVKLVPDDAAQTLESALEHVEIFYVWGTRYDPTLLTESSGCTSCTLI